jgi:hypothetical protein
MPTAADRALGLLPFMRVDEQSDTVLEALVTAWMTGLERPAEVGYGEPWQALSDPAVAPLWALPHAALYTGGSMPVRVPGEDDTTFLLRARAEVVRPRGMRRGAWSALAIRIQSTLTGTRFVSIVEWVDGSPWKLAARVRDDELPDLDATYRAANAADLIPAGMHVEIVAATGPVWDEMGAETWDSMTTTTWDDLEG